MAVHLYFAPWAGDTTTYLVNRARHLANGLANEPRVLVASRL